jgi:predicted transcriptional regulator
MDVCLQLFTIAELNALDEKQLEILRHAVRNEILNEIQTNPNFRSLLKNRVDTAYNTLKP